MSDETIETVEDTVEETQETPTDEVTDTDFDYDAELEALNEQKRKNFEGAKARVEKKKELPVDEIIKKAVNEAKQEFISQFTKDAIEDELAKIENPKERELVKHHYENSIVRSGTSREATRADIEKARAIANYSSLKKRSSEELLSKETKESVGVGTGFGGSMSTKPVKEDYEKFLTPTDLAFGKKRGWSKEMYKRLAEQKMQRGAYQK